MENIFIEQNFQFFKDRELKINHGKLKNIHRFVAEVNENPGYLFVYNKNHKEIYIAEIIGISDIEKTSSNSYILSINTQKYSINLFSDFEKYDQLVLEMLYSRNQNKTKITVGYSIKEALKRGNFKFSRPFIFNFDFLLHSLNSNNFIDRLLYNKSFFNDWFPHKIYAKYIVEDGIPHFSLTNEKMIDYDYMSLEFIDDVYRPFFYEFFISNYGLNQFTEFNDGDIYEVIVSEREYQQQSNTSQVFIGELLFSVSDILKVPAKLTIIRKVSNENEKNNVINGEIILKEKLINIAVKDKSVIEQSIMAKFPTFDDLKIEVTVYNVGQGNWSKIKTEDSKNNILDIVYDIGIGHSKNIKLSKEIAKYATNNLNDNHIFILSHWDLDHIKGISNLSDTQFHTTWIVPELPPNLSFSAIRLANYLQNDPNINVIFVSEIFNNKEIFSNNYLSLGKGEGKGSGVNVVRNGFTSNTSYTLNNNIGLILTIKHNNKEILFTGDCEYNQLPNTFLGRSYFALLISHHGAKIKYHDLENIGMISSQVIESQAIVCVGKNNLYPHSAHKKSIEDIGYSVIETRNYTQLNNQIKISLI